jgi:hypothetical protein
MTGLVMYGIRMVTAGTINRQDIIFLPAILFIIFLLYKSPSDHVLRQKSKAGFWSKPLAGFLLVFISSSTIYFLLPDLVFDDAAIILRYMDNFGKGHFFKYNSGDAPVYGISGFIHGLFAGLLSYLHMAGSRQALMISNCTGFVFTSWFVYSIYKNLSRSSFFAFAAYLVTITTARSFLSVANSGLETSLHLSIVTAAIYFFLKQRFRPFYFFTALMIISKLDAVPIAITLLGYYFVVYGKNKSYNKSFATELLRLGLFFLLPFVAGLAIITLVFGSPLPQSAFAKLYYHTHPTGSWFPFLAYFTNNGFRLLLLIGGMALWVTVFIDALYHRNRSLLINGLWGSLFLSGIALYYFYNPGEQMIWYYAMPELFLIMQLIHGIYYFSTTYPFPSAHTTRWTLPLFFVPFCIVSWEDVTHNLNDLVMATKVVEHERTAIGDYIRDISTTEDTLLSSHGLPTRFFRGYVIDLSGLNSKLATQYHLNADSIISRFRPALMINHAFPEVAPLVNRYNYRVLAVYRNITAYNNHSWILLKRATRAAEYKIAFLDTTLNKNRYTMDGRILKMNSTNSLISLKDTCQSTTKTLHIGVAADYNKQLLTTGLYKKGTFMKSFGTRVSAFSTTYAVINNIRLDISGADSVVLRLANSGPFSVIEPIFKRSDKNFNDFMWQRHE